MKNSLPKLWLFLFTIISFPSFGKTFPTNSTLPFDLDNGAGYASCASRGTKAFTFPVSCVGTLNTTTNQLFEINIRLDATCGSNLRDITCWIVSPSGTCVQVASTMGTTTNYTNTPTNRVDYTFRNTNGCLNKAPNYAAFPASVPILSNANSQYGVFSSVGNISTGFNGENADGTWTLYFAETAASAPCVSAASIGFGDPAVLNRTANGENCTNAINWNGEPICASTLSKTPSANMPGWTGSGFTGACQWNNANNNDTWIEFTASSTNICFSLSGIVDNLQSIVVTDPNTDGDNNPCTGTNGTYWTVVSCPRDNIYTAVTGTPRNHNHCFTATVGRKYYIVVDGNGGAESPFYLSGVSGFTPPNITCRTDTVVCINTAPFTLSGSTPAGGTYSGSGVSANIFSPAVAGAGPHQINYRVINGCDTFNCNFNILVNATSIIQDTTACDSLVIDGRKFFSSTVYDTIISGGGGGCDILATFNITIKNSISTFESRTSCNPADTGIIIQNLLRLSGCDSVHTITTTLLPSSNTFENITSCNPADTGVVVQNLLNRFNCDSIHTITTSLLPISLTFENRTSCNPADTGVVIQNLTNQYNCDSTHTITTILLPSDSTFEFNTSCNQADTGTFIQTLSNVDGCDSIHINIVSLINEIETFAFSSSCNPSDTGAFISNYTSIDGCDSTHTLNVSLTPPDTTYESRSSCDISSIGEVILINTNQFGCDSVHIITTAYSLADTTIEFNSSCNPADTGIFVFSYTSSVNCDSFHVVITSLAPPDSTFEFNFSCNPADTGVFIFNGINQFGCDSVHSLSVALSPSDSTFEFNTSCNPLDTGVFVFNSLNQYSCDSVHTLSVSLSLSDSTFEFSSSCLPADTGVFVFNGLNQFGCDSVHTITVTLSPSDSTFEFNTSANPLDTGVVVINGVNQFGCDSVHTITTTLLAVVDSTFEFTTSCNPADTGVFVFTYLNQSGADSIHIVTTTLLPSSASSESRTTCDASLVGTITLTLVNQFGCDSLHTITTTLAPGDATFENRTTCDQNAVGVVTLNLLNQAGCDSVHTITTTLSPADATFENQTTCDPNAVGTFTFNYTNRFGCDSAHSITYTLSPAQSSNVFVNLCRGNSVFAGGGLQTTDGTYVDNLFTTQGCDSTVTTYVTVSELPIVSIAVPQDTIIRGESVVLSAVSNVAVSTYLWNPPTALSCDQCQNPTASPNSNIIYILNVTDVNGCSANAFTRITVLSDSCNRNIFIPSAFTPNGDGNNDVFQIYGNCIASMKMRIFNRWGELVFESNDINQAWDGIYKGAMQTGVYTYTLSVEFKDGRKDNRNERRGSITLVK